MVKIRFPRHSTMSQRSVIQICIDKTSLKFNNNIVANRFEQTTITTHEVTIKCLSSRGKGAKRGSSGRRTTSCCWHVWGTFFDELFARCPDIVIIAQGNRITRESGNWVDRLNGSQHESEMCDCEAEGWVRESPVDTLIDRAMEAGREAVSMARDNAERRCDNSCRYSRTNNNGVPCSRDCIGSGNPGWEPVVTTIERHCSNCRHSSDNNARHTLCNVECGGDVHDQYYGWELYIPPTLPPLSERTCQTCEYNHTNPANNNTPRCPPGRCHHEDGQQLWAPRISHHDEPNTSCSRCRFQPNHHGNGSTCPHHQNNTCLIDGQHRRFERWVDTVERRCDRSCKHNSENNNGNCCTLICDHTYSAWEPYVTPVITTTEEEKTCVTCKYYHTACSRIIGVCVCYNKWTPRFDNEGFDPEPYLQKPQVMPEEKEYMDFEGVM